VAERDRDRQRSMVERIESIAVWRRGREQQDMYGLGPEVAARSHRSADGLLELAAFIRNLDPNDGRLVRLGHLAFHHEHFDPGATMLHELGRFRFHDESATIPGFVERMVELAALDASERDEPGGPQVPGDNPWTPGWLNLDEEEDNW